jgi:hypothetical protein
LEPFAGPLKVALILAHDQSINGLEATAIAAITILEAILVPFAIFKLLSQPGFRSWRNVAVTLIAMAGAMPGALLLIGSWLPAGGDWGA